jgi:hypothetical protein
MVKTRLARTNRGQISQIESERCDDRFRISGSTAADLIQDDRSYGECIVLASVLAEGRKHSSDQMFVAFYGH